MTAVSIITIGDELLIGQVIDTNSAWMAQALNKAGYKVKRRVAVGDVWDEIWQALDDEQEHASVILITGGLGPTADDITKPLLCEYFGGKMVQDKAAMENVTYLFEKILKKEITPRNLKQADVPDTCTVLQNKRGTAPGMLFKKNGKIFVSLPGVPYEMQGLMTDAVIPFLQEHFSPEQIIHKTLITFGIGESMLADLIQDFEEALPSNIKLAYLPNSGQVRLRLSATGAEKGITEKFLTLQHLVKEYLITDEDEPMEKILGKLLVKNNKTLGTAESCTGGYIAHLITSIPGSSAYYHGSVVSYTNALKASLLHVPENILEVNGAVSEPVVINMVKGLLQTIKTDYAIAVSGIMGPDGGTEEKPTGTVWMAVGNNSRQIAQKFYFRFNRQKNIQLTALNAMNMLRLFILAEQTA